MFFVKRHLLMHELYSFYLVAEIMVHHVTPWWSTPRDETNGKCLFCVSVNDLATYISQISKPPQKGISLDILPDNKCGILPHTQHLSFHKASWALNKRQGLGSELSSDSFRHDGSYVDRARV